MPDRAALFSGATSWPFRKTYPDVAKKLPTPVLDVVERYLGTRSPKTAKAYAGAFSKFLNWCKGSRIDFTAVNKNHIERYITRLTLDGHLDATIRSSLSAIKEIYLALYSARVIDRFPVYGIQVSAVIRETRLHFEDPKRFSSEEIANALEDSRWGDDPASIRDRAALSTAFYAQATATDLRFMKRSDLGAKVLTVGAKKHSLADGFYKRILNNYAGLVDTIKNANWMFLRLDRSKRTLKNEQTKAKDWTDAVTLRMCEERKVLPDVRIKMPTLRALGRKRVEEINSVGLKSR